jgi:hypothetical protein
MAGRAAEKWAVRSAYGAVLLALLPLAAAPVPPPKPMARPDVAGVWDMKWDSTGWVATFSPGGFYRSRGRGWSYEGRWEMKGDVLTITEKNVSVHNGHWSSYRWELLPGRLESRCGAFRLRKAR